MSQKTSFFIVTVVKTSNLTYFILLLTRRFIRHLSRFQTKYDFLNLDPVLLPLVTVVTLYYITLKYMNAISYPIKSNRVNSLFLSLFLVMSPKKFTRFFAIKSYYDFDKLKIAFTSQYRPNCVRALCSPSNCYDGALSPAVKWRGREADHSPPTISDFKETWVYASTPPFAFMK
jgi:hypothetical protein